MFKIWVVSAAVAVGLVSIASSSASAMSRQQAISACRAEGIGRGGSSPDATRMEMQACVKRKMGGKARGKKARGK
jgi:hypothetical protein